MTGHLFGSFIARILLGCSSVRIWHAPTPMKCVLQLLASDEAVAIAVERRECGEDAGFRQVAIGHRRAEKLGVVNLETRK